MNAPRRIASVFALALALLAKMTAAPSAVALVPPPAAPLTRGPGECHAVAFTFDLCPVKEGGGVDTPLIEYLIANRIHATFFASGEWIASHDAEVRRLIAQPFFEIGTHGARHAHLPLLTAAEQRTEILGPIDVLAAKYGVHSRVFRPPFGEFNDDTLRQADALGQTVVMWSVVSGDPDPKLLPSRIIDDVVWRVKNGSIVVFHANGRGWHTDEVFPKVYAEVVTKHGEATRTISELRAGCAAR